MPPSISTTASGQRVAHLDQRVERRDGAVDLPAAVVRDDHAVDTVVQRELRVVRRQHALDEQRQRRLLAQPIEVVPRQADVRERREHRRGRGEQVLGRRLVEPRQEDRVGEELAAALALQERQVGVAAGRAAASPASACRA